MAYNIRKTKRLIIYKELLETNTAIQFSVDSKIFRVPLDDFHAYLKENTNVLNTSSWIDKGLFHWPRPTKKLFLFLEPYNITNKVDDEDEGTENTHWDNMLETLQAYKLENGHCYVATDYNQTNYEVQDPLVTWVLKVRKDYIERNINSNKLRALDDIGFLKWTNLKQYFKPENIIERNTLIDALKNVENNTGD